jgi:hypothetical protein
MVAQLGQRPGRERGDTPGGGDVRAIRQIRSRIASPITLGRPPLHFGSSAANPRSLNAWITSRTYSALTCINDVMSGTACPWADINTTIARRNRTGSFAVRPIRASFRPSSIDNDRTNTSGRRPTTTSRSTWEDQPRLSAHHTD